MARPQASEGSNTKDTSRGRNLIQTGETEHHFVARLIECSCGQYIDERAFEKHLLNAAKAKAISGIEKALRVL